jgi:hypothetical protein
MNHRFSPFLLVLLASLPVVDVVADSTDEALNQFYVENMASQLTSQAVGTANEKAADKSARGKERKAHKEAKIQPSSKAQVRSDQTTNSFFTYRSSAAVTNTVYANYISSIDPRFPNVKAFAARELAEKGIEKRFDDRFSRYGFSSHDSSDSYAGYLIVMWEIINNQNASAHPSGIRQVRQKVNELLLAKFGSKSIPDATKQYYSEYFKLLAVCYADAIKHPEFVASEAQGVRNFAYYYTRKLGIDLKKFRLTDAGFQQI